LRGTIFCQMVTGVPKNHTLLHGIILLFAFVQNKRSLLKSSLDSCQTWSCLKFADAGQHSVLSFAKSIASDRLKEIEPYWSAGPSLFSGAFRLTPAVSARNNFGPEGPQCVYYWIYDICGILASLGHCLDWARSMIIKMGNCEHYYFLCLVLLHIWE
jgi:hypothetical protein